MYECVYIFNFLSRDNSKEVALGVTTIVLELSIDISIIYFLKNPIDFCAIRLPPDRRPEVHCANFFLAPLRF